MSVKKEEIYVKEKKRNKQVWGDAEGQPAIDGALPWSRETHLRMCCRDEVVCNLADYITCPVPTATVHHGRQFLAVAATDGGDVAVDDIDGAV